MLSPEKHNLGENGRYHNLVIFSSKPTQGCKHGRLRSIDSRVCRDGQPAMRQFWCHPSLGGKWLVRNVRDDRRRLAMLAMLAMLPDTQTFFDLQIEESYGTLHVEVQRFNWPCFPSKSPLAVVIDAGWRLMKVCLGQG